MKPNKDDYDQWSSWFRKQIMEAFAATFNPPPAMWAYRKGEAYNEFAKAYITLWNNDRVHVEYFCNKSNKNVTKPLRVRLQDFVHSPSQKVDTSLDHIEDWWKRENMLSNQKALGDAQGKPPTHPKVSCGQKGMLLLALLYWFENKTKKTKTTNLVSRWKEVGLQKQISLDEEDFNQWVVDRFKEYNPKQDVETSISIRQAKTELPNKFAMLYLVKTPHVDLDSMNDAFEHEFFDGNKEEDDVLFRSGLGYVIGYVELSRRGYGSRYESESWVAIGLGDDGDSDSVEQRGDPHVTSGHFDQEGILCVYQAFTKADTKAIKGNVKSASKYTGLLKANRVTGKTPVYANYRYSGYFKWIGEELEVILRSAKMHFWRGDFHCLILKSPDDASTPNIVVKDNSLSRKDALYDWLYEDNQKNEKALIELFRVNR